MLRSEERSTGQVKSGRKARWERAWQRGQGPHHAGLDRYIARSSNFVLCSVESHQSVSSRGVMYVICFSSG